MKKFKLIFDKEKEISWLNEMARNGWNLERFGFGLYTFGPCPKGEYVYEADLKDKLTHLSEEYRSILEAQNIEIIPSAGFWFLVRRKAKDGPLELYTDSESKAGQYSRIRFLFKAVTVYFWILNFLCVFVWNRDPNWFIAIISFLCSLVSTSLAGDIIEINQKIADLERKPEHSSRWLILGEAFYLTALILLLKKEFAQSESIGLILAGLAVSVISTGLQMFRVKKR